jgi:hypothetical protein
MTPVLAQGFKAECEEISREYRGELGLGREDRFDPWALAEHLHIDVDSIFDLRESEKRDVRRLTKLDQDGFSAATAFCGSRCRILFNPALKPVRQRESISHELGHILIEHEPTWPPFDEHGRRFSREQEEAEADYMAATLLAPEEGVGPIFADFGRDLGAAGDHLGISVRLMRQRIEECCPPSPLLLEAEATATTLAEEDFDGSLPRANRLADASPEASLECEG